MSESDAMHERIRLRREAETADPGSTVNPGDYLGVWARGVHPYGKPQPCPFCAEEVDYTSLWYNGPGSPPSYALCCGNCGAKGPISEGRERGDHVGAREDAVQLWNNRGGRPRDPA